MGTNWPSYLTPILNIVLIVAVCAWFVYTLLERGPLTDANVRACAEERDRHRAAMDYLDRTVRLEEERDERRREEARRGGPRAQNGRVSGTPGQRRETDPLLRRTSPDREGEEQA